MIVSKDDSQQASKPLPLWPFNDWYSTPRISQTETATVWAGYMEGAVRSAERVAAEVLMSMNRLD